MGDGGAGFDDFCKELCSTVDRFGGEALHVETDADTEAVRVTGGAFTPLARARSGLADIAELSSATAEHHPYWEILSRCCQISSVVLDEWNGSLNKEDMDEMRWAIQRLDEACKKIGAQKDGRADQ